MFKKATRRKAKLKIALAGPSGSGKTASALLIAKGIGGKIAVVDTENDSASLYAGQEIGGQKMPDFDTLNLKPPYTSKAYLAAMQAAVTAGYDILIVDSVSHQWAGEGGVLRRKEAKDQQPGSNSWTNWGSFTPEQESFTTSLLQYPLHLIVTMRSKQEYALVQQDGKKAKVEKLGMAPVQRDGMEYEFTSFIDIDITHKATSSKDRTGIFEGKYFNITEETGKALAEWLNAGSEDVGSTGVSLDTLQQVGAGVGPRPPNASQPQPRPQQQAQPPKPKVDPNRPLTLNEFDNIHKTALQHLWSEEEFVLYMRRKYKTILAQKLTLQNGMDFHKVIVSMTGAEALQTVPAEKPPADAIKPAPQPSQSVQNEAQGPQEAFPPPPEENPPYPDLEGGDPIQMGDPQGEFANFQPGAPTA